MSNFELPSHSPNFDVFWQQWLARQASVLTTDSTQDITNKTFDLSLNTLTGTTAEFNAALSDSNFLTDASIGSTVQAWDSGLDALAAFNTNGFLVQTAANTFAGRTITGTANEITVTNGSGVSGNPVISLPASLDFTGKTVTNVTLVDPTLSGTVAGSPTASGAWTFTNAVPITISSTTPELRLYQTNGGVNAKGWTFKTDPATVALIIGCETDDFSAANNAIKITRTGVVPDNIDFFVTTITRNGTLVLDRTNTAIVTNKSISLTNNTLTGTKAEFNTALTDANFLFDDLVGTSVQAWDADLDAIAALSSTGLAARTAANTWAQRTITGTANEITVTNGNGVSGDPTLSLPSALTFTGKTVTGGEYASPTFSGTIAGSPTASGTWTFSTTGTAENVIITSTDAGAIQAPLLVLYRDSASPAVDDVLGRVELRGRDAGANTVVYAAFTAQAYDVASGSASGRFIFQTLKDGTVNTRGYLQEGFVIGSPAGGDKGAGTINAQAVYDDGVILTDYVPDAYMDGDYSVTDYDNRVPPRRDGGGTVIERRQHGPARRFKQNFDELDPAAFASKWKASRKLPAFNRGPEKKSTGEAIQALIESVEIAFVHLDKHETRIQALEP